MFAHVIWMRRAEILLTGWVGIGAKHLSAGWKPLETVPGGCPRGSDEINLMMRKTEPLGGGVFISGAYISKDQ